MNWKRFALLLPLIAGLFIAGCSDDDDIVGPPDSYDLTDNDFEDAAEDFGATLADPDEGMLQFWLESVDGGGAGVMSLPGKGNERTALDTTFLRGSMTVNIDLTFYDADSNASEMYDPEATVRLTRLLTIEGTHEGLRRQVTVNHEGFAEVTGITPDDTIRTLNGNGSRTVEGTFEALVRDLQRTWQAEHQWTTTNLRFHRDRELYPYPLEGEVVVATSFEREMSRDGITRTFDIEIEYTVTFDGTRYAHVEIGDSIEFWIDLDEGFTHRGRPGGL